MIFFARGLESKKHKSAYEFIIFTSPKKTYRDVFHNVKVRKTIVSNKFFEKFYYEILDLRQKMPTFLEVQEQFVI